MTFETFKTVSISDPALDLEAMDPVFVKFMRERDMSLVRIIEGARPRYFHLGHIDMAIFRSYVSLGGIDSHSVTPEAAWRAFECGVVRIEMEDGSAMEPQKEDVLANGQVRRRWREDQLEVFSPAEVIEIGSLCYTRALLGKARKAHFALPPGWAHVWTNRVPHSAAAADAAARLDPG